MRAALIKDGIVENIIIAQEAFTLDGYVVVPIGRQRVVVGSSYDGRSFTPPAPTPRPVPQSITARQIRLGLLSLGWLDNLEAAIASLAPAQRRLIKIEWDFTTDIARDGSLVAAIKSALNITENQIDTLFRTAANL